MLGRSGEVLSKQTNPRPIETGQGTFAIQPHPSQTVSVLEIKMSRIDKLSELLQHNRELGLAELAKLPPGSETKDIYMWVFEDWASNPANSLDAAVVAYGLPTGSNRMTALQAVICTWAHNAPQALLDWASSMATVDSVPLQAALTNIAESQSQPALASQYLDKLPDATARNQVIDTIATAMGKADPAGTLDWLNKTATGDTYDSNINNLIGNLAKHDPEQAATLTGSIPDPEVQASAINNLASTWGSTDPQAALAWASGLPDSTASVRNSAISSTIAGWAKTDPRSALAFVQNSPNPTAFLCAAPIIADSLSKTDPPAALNWANSLPAGAAKDQALSNVLINSAAADFNSAWNVATSLPTGDGRDLAMANLVGVEANKNPTQAAAIVGQLSAGSAQISATGQLAAAWVVQDTNGFIAWVLALPSGDQHDAALSAALKAVQSAKLPQAQRDILVQKLAQAQHAGK